MTPDTEPARRDFMRATRALTRADIKSALKPTIFDYTLSLVGLGLLLTDVFRSGLGTVEVVRGHATRVEPGKILFFGPYNYPVVDIRANEHPNAYTATANATVWSYKYDSVSTGMRALAELLNVSAYPACLRYQEECTDPINIAWSTAFRMIDEMVDAIQHNVQQNIGAPLLFTTQILWIDRVHQILVQHLWQQSQKWMHRAYYFPPRDPQPLTLCLPPLRGRRQPDYQLPTFCSMTFRWVCTEGNSSFPIWEHIAYRMKVFQQRYPDLTIDMSMITNERLGTNRYAVSQFPQPHAFLREWGLEVTTWIRGRRCHSSDGLHESCTTVVVSDYRYELGTVEHDTAEWLRVTSVLRAFAQLYVLARISLYFVAVFAMQSVENVESSLMVNWHRRVIAAWKTFPIIPPQVLIYGSYVPVVANAVAHLIDCSNVHVLGETMWNGLEGRLEFNLWTHIRTTTVLMRNTWVLVLGLQLSIVIQTSWCRSTRWHPSLGIRGVRETVIGFVSAFTIFAEARRRDFRNSNIVTVQMLPRAAMSLFTAGLLEGFALPAGFFFDVKILVLSFIAVTSLVLVARIIVVLVSRCVYRPQSLAIVDILFPRAESVPLATGSLYSTLVLTVHWEIPRRNSLASSPTKLNAIAPSIHEKSASHSHDQRQSGCTDRQGSQGSNAHEFRFDVDSAGDVQTIVRLFNLAMITDPMVLLRLRVLGMKMYDIKVQDSGAQAPVFMLLPYKQHDYVETYQREAEVDQVFEEVSSVDLPWGQLIACA